VLLFIDLQIYEKKNKKQCFIEFNITLNKFRFIYNVLNIKYINSLLLFESVKLKIFLKIMQLCFFLKEIFPEQKSVN